MLLQNVMQQTAEITVQLILLKSMYWFLLLFHAKYNNRKLQIKLTQFILQIFLYKIIIMTTIILKLFLLLFLPKQNKFKATE